MRTNRENYKYYLKCEKYRHFDINLNCLLAKPENCLLLRFSEVVREINTRVIEDFFCAPGNFKICDKEPPASQQAAVKKKQQGKPAF